MMLPIRRRLGNALGFLACASLMAYALYAEHVLGLAPCPLCVFQRIAVIAAGLLFLLAALHDPARRGARVYGVVISVAALAGMLVSARHVWIQAQPPGTVAACGADLNYLLEIMPLTEVVSKVLTGSGECGAVDWTLLGLSMPWWVLVALGTLGAWAVVVNFFSADKKRLAVGS